MHTSSCLALDSIHKWFVVACRSAAKQKASSTGRDTNTHSHTWAQYTFSHLYYSHHVCAAIEAHRARLARIKKRFQALLWMQRIHRGISFLREGCSVYKSPRHCIISPL